MATLVNNRRRQQYKKNRLAGMDMYNSAINAGYSHATAKNAYDKFRSVEEGGIKTAFMREGLTDEKIVEHALKGMNAERSIIIDGKDTGIKMEDWPTRHKYFNTTLQLTGRIKNDKEQLTGDTKIMIIRADTVNNISSSTNNTETIEVVKSDES